MAEAIWIRTDMVLAVHQRQVAEHGGETGVRDANLLQSALARPLNLWAYSEPKPDMAALAASYAFGIAKNHAFVDGNKRTALVTCRMFLVLNGFDLCASQEEKYLTFRNLAAGEIDEASLTEWLRKHRAQA